jgi:hypothetical protein
MVEVVAPDVGLVWVVPVDSPFLLDSPSSHPAVPELATSGARGSLGCVACTPTSLGCVACTPTRHGGRSRRRGMLFIFPFAFSWISH